MANGDSVLTGDRRVFDNGWPRLSGPGFRPRRSVELVPRVKNSDRGLVAVGVQWHLVWNEFHTTRWAGGATLCIKSCWCRIKSFCRNDLWPTENSVLAGGRRVFDNGWPRLPAPRSVELVPRVKNSDRGLVAVGVQRHLVWNEFHTTRWAGGATLCIESCSHRIKPLCRNDLWSPEISVLTGDRRVFNNGWPRVPGAADNGWPRLPYGHRRLQS